jgi:pimeloyl-ACP methyl ester carboxylesterase
VNPQVEMLASLLKSLRKGDYTLGVKPAKLVLVGHSFGSAVSNFILQRHPDLAEAAVLTGFAFPNGTDPAASISGLGLSVFASRIVSTLPEAAKPQFAKTFDDGWLSFGDKYAFTESFLGAEDYDVASAEYAFKITQPYSAVDFLSVFAKMSVADKFQGKLLFAPAERDLFFCGGDCKDTFGRGVQGQAFPLLKKTDVSMYVQEASGHGQNFASNAKDMYAAVVKFVDGL